MQTLDVTWVEEQGFVVDLQPRTTSEVSAQVMPDRPSIFRAFLIWIDSRRTREELPQAHCIE